MNITFTRQRPAPRGCGWLFLLGFGLVFLVVGLLLGGSALQAYQAAQHYPEGKCTITSKELVQVRNKDSDSGRISYTYRPSFEFLVQTVDGKHYQTSGYGLTDESTSDRDGQQRILDRFQIEHTYQCWYDPANPQRAVLSRDFPWIMMIVGGVFALIGTVCLLIMLFFVFKGLLLIWLFRRSTQLN